MVRKRGTKPLRKPADEPMTPERRRHAGPDGIATGDDKMGGKRYTILAPLERLFARKGIEPVAYQALAKYRVHWYHGGIGHSVGSMDLNRVFASDPSNISGLAKTERQMFHKDQYRRAVQKLGMRSSYIVERIVCADFSLEVAGGYLGYASPYRAREAAIQVLKDAGKELAKLWGM